MQGRGVVARIVAWLGRKPRGRYRGRRAVRQVHARVKAIELEHQIWEEVEKLRRKGVKV